MLNSSCFLRATDLDDGDLISWLFSKPNNVFLDISLLFILGFPLKFHNFFYIHLFHFHTAGIPDTPLMYWTFSSSDLFSFSFLNWSSTNQFLTRLYFIVITSTNFTSTSKLFTTIYLHILNLISIWLFAFSATAEN